MPDPARALPPVLQETRDVTLGQMLALLALIAAVLALTLGAVWWMFPTAVRDARFTRPFPDFPAPQLQPRPPLDMQDLRAAQLRALDSAGWVDRDAGRVHIPVDQAMRDIAAQGIAGWPVAAATPTERR
jgi:hypothetical protein